MSSNEGPSGLGDWLRDPLGYFLIASLLVYALYDWVQADGEGDADSSVESSTIVVDRKRLEEFVAYRTRLFDEARVRERLDAMSEQQRGDLIRDYVREEALYRSAIDFGLDANDYVIRRRLVQKMDFMAEGVNGAGDEPNPQTLAAFFSENSERYAQPANITLTHAFFSTAMRSATEAEQLAITARDSLNARQAEFADGLSVGERFVYQNNYVERTRQEIEDHFGSGFANTVFSPSVELGSWIGPLQSPVGFHVVYIAQRESAQPAALDNVLPRVRRDFLAERAQTDRSEFADAIVSRFDVLISAEFSAAAGEVR
ncbi:MAG: peptidyl-prolyl cis-trans isomerase [Pseudomonadaceae bacterium]|nr:peptidyl-prolyl cis-trans isomerase [Pseudomonadaceae bacterium]